MKNNNYLIKDIYQEKNQTRIYEMHKKKLKEINHQYPKLEDQKIMKTLSEKHNMIKTVSKFFNQEAFLEQQRVNQKLLVKIMNPNILNMRQQNNSSRKEIKTQMDSKRISEENKSLANRITNLPPVINAKKQDKDYKKHINDVILMQKYHTTRLIEYQDKETFQLIQKLTNQKFGKSKFANLNFLNHLNKTQKFIMFMITSMELFNQKKHTSFMGKNPPTYLCEFHLDEKNYYKSNQVQIDEFLEQISGFLCHEFTLIQIAIKKYKQNEEFIIGEVIYSESQSQINTIQLKENSIIKVSDEIRGEIKKKIGDDEVIVGLLKFKVFQFCQNNGMKQLAIPEHYAINIKQSTPKPSVKDMSSIASQQQI